MTYQDFHNMMHDHTLTRAETTITQENGAPLSFRDFEKNVRETVGDVRE